RSPDVKGAPSCQVMPGRSRQVVSISPPALTTQEPSSTEGMLAARRGTRTPSLLMLERLGLTSSIRSLRPGVLVAPELRARLSPGGTPAMAIVTRLGAAAVWAELPSADVT